MNTKSHIGESIIANNGQKFTITAFRDRNDIDGQFEDGTIVEHKSYLNFQRGNIKNPNQPYRTGKNHVGERYMQHCGMAGTITVCNGYDDNEFTFDDGTIVEHRKYRNIKAGKVDNPNVRRPTKAQEGLHVGEVYYTKSGHSLEISAYRNYYDVDVKIDGGAAFVTGVKFANVKKGMIRISGIVDDAVHDQNAPDTETK